MAGETEKVGERTPAPPVDALGPVQAFALLLPALLLAWPGPGSLLRSDFLPQATGAGAAALATLPAAILLVLRRVGPGARGLALFLIPLLFAAGWLALGRIADPFEARRAVLHWATALVLLLGGASLSPAGLKIFARGIVCVALLLLAVALADGANGLAGALGNTGSVAQAALPGAVVGACFASSGSRAWRMLGGLALLLFLAFVARAPVIAGGLALSVGLAAFALARADLSRVLRGAFLGLALLAALGALAPLAVPFHASGRGTPGTDGPAAGSAGGFEVRARIWSRSLSMLRDSPWLGVGPGQFAASFPPYRDPREIELSTHGRALPEETEVEHPHQDWLAPALDLGAIAGLAWIAFLLAVARGSWRALRGGDDPLAALGAAALSFLAYALVHAPLTGEPAAAALAYAAFGAVLARPLARPAPPSRRLVPVAALVLLAAFTPRALAMVRHSRSLSALARPGERDAAEVEERLSAALDDCPDSVLALALRARLAEQRGADPAAVRAAWERVLALRPFRVEARMQLALTFVRAGDRPRARQEYERALALDPTHPGILQNLRLLDLQEGCFDGGRRWLAGADPNAEQCFARSKAERAGGDKLLADLFEARAHLLWARAHAAGGRFADAVRSYRQCLRVTREHEEGGAARVRLELAAALLADGRGEEARAEIDAIHPGPADWSAMPDWAAGRLAAIRSGK
jgi:O-antigen ligase